MTNLEFIKNMTVEEMADFIRQISYYEDDTKPILWFCLDSNYKSLYCRKDEIVNWLNSEKN